MLVKFTHVRTEKLRDGGNPPLGYLVHVSEHKTVKLCHLQSQSELYHVS